MAERLSTLNDLTDDFFKTQYNTYQVPSQALPTQRYGAFLPSLRTRQDCIDVNQFLMQLQTHAFEPQYSNEYMPQYPVSSGKALYPTLDFDYNQQQPDMTPSTGLYPQLFDQTALPSSTYVGMGSRMPYDQTKVVHAPILQKAPPAPRAGSEELVEDMEKMDVDSESKDKKSEETKVKKEEKIKEKKAKHLELIKKLQKLVQEMILAQENGEEETRVKNESPVLSSVAVEAH